MSLPTTTTRASTSELLGRLYRDHIRHYRRFLALAVVAMIVAAASTAAFAKLIEPILDQIFIAKNEAALWPIALMVLAVFTLRGFATYAEALLMNRVGQGIIRDLQNRMFAHIATADLAFFQNQAVGHLVSRFTFDVGMLRSAVSNTITGIGKDVLTLVFLLSLLIYQDAYLALWVLVIFPLAGWPIARLGRMVRKVAGNTQGTTGEYTSFLEQIFHGIRHVKANTAEGAEIARAGRLAETLFNLSQRAQRYRSLSAPLMEIIGAAAISAVILYGGHQVITGVKTTGEFFSFITALLLAYEPMKNLAKLNAGLQEGMASAQRVYDLLAYRPAIVDAPRAKEFALAAGGIEFQDVSFSYNADAPVLRGVNLRFAPKTCVALVGASGGGKTTVLNLIPRFYDVQMGRILIDDQDVRSVTMQSLREKIALVSQETLLFDDTVMANIAYGKPSASVAEIERAASLAGAHDFIRQLPNGYATHVGPQGSKLSGGQRQRIAIARAMLKDAPILLLDEATSALDSETERQVQGALQTLMQGRTTIMVAHRLSTILHADWIYVIDQGRIIEQGKHAELLAMGGAYATMYYLQHPLVAKNGATV